MPLGAALFHALRQDSTSHTPKSAKVLPPKLPTVAAASSVMRTIAKPQFDSIPLRLGTFLGQEDRISFNARYAALKKLLPPLAGDEVLALYALHYRHGGEDLLPEDAPRAFKRNTNLVLPHRRSVCLRLQQLMFSLTCTPPARRTGLRFR